MTKNELVKICAEYLQMPLSKVKQSPKEALEYLYFEKILPSALEHNTTLIDNN